jgi:hypothetical protein
VKIKRLQFGDPLLDLPALVVDGLVGQRQWKGLQLVFCRDQRAHLGQLETGHLRFANEVDDFQVVSVVEAIPPLTLRLVDQAHLLVQSNGFWGAAGQFGESSDEHLSIPYVRQQIL